MGWTWIFVGLAVAAGCVKSEVIDCGDGRVCPVGSACDNMHQLCVAPDQLTQCATAEQASPCTATGVAEGFCREGVCLPAVCGDGILSGLEVCDGDQFLETNCTALDFYDDVTLLCNDDCSYDTNVCTGFCGDSMINGSELCDGADPVEMCADIGYDAGYLTCHQCGPGLDDCRFIGWQDTIVGSGTKDIHGTSDNDIFVVGTNSVFHHSGKVWTRLDIAACAGAGADHDYTGVWAYAPGAAFVVGVDKVAMTAVALHITGAGTGCTKTTIASVASVDSVYAVSATDVYAAGDLGLGIYHFDGAAWTQVHVGDVFALWGTGPTDIFAGGDNALLHSTGGAFTAVAGAPLLGLVDTIWGKDSSDMFVSFHTTGAGAYSGVQHFKDGAWTQTFTGGAGAAYGYYNADRSFVSASARIRSYDDNTGEWFDLGLPQSALTTGRVATFPIWASPRGYVYLAGGGKVTRYLAGAWDENGVGVTSGVLAVGSHNRAAYAVGATDFWIYDGTVWTKDAGAPASFADAWIDSSTGAIFGIQNLNGAAGVWRKDGGAAWVNAHTFTGEVIFGFSPTDIWLADVTSSDTSVVRHWDGTLNGGITCTTCDLPANIFRFWGAAPNDVYALGGSHLFHWNGSVWSEVLGVVTTMKGYALHGSASNDIYIGDEDGVLKRFDGTNWTTIYDFPVGILSIWAFAPNDVFVAGQTAKLYHWDGMHWYPVRIDSFSALSELHGVGDVLFLTDETGKVFRLVRSTPW